jgi:hypothetical protein
LSPTVWLYSRIWIESNVTVGRRCFRRPLEFVSCAGTEVVGVVVVGQLDERMYSKFGAGSCLQDDVRVARGISCRENDLFKIGLSDDESKSASSCDNVSLIFDPFASRLFSLLLLSACLSWWCSCCCNVDWCTSSLGKTPLQGDADEASSDDDDSSTGGGREVNNPLDGIGINFSWFPTIS